MYGVSFYQRCLTPLQFKALVKGNPLEILDVIFLWKARILAFETQPAAVLSSTQYVRVTDGQTDLLRLLPRYSIRELRLC